MSHDGARAASKPGRDGDLAPLLAALLAADRGDFAVRLPVERTEGSMRDVAQAFNNLIERNEMLASEMVRVERVVGREGRMTERASLGDGASGGWAASIGSINALIGDLVKPTTEVARVLIAVAEGDLTQKMALEIDRQPVRGEFLRISTTVNSMVDQLSSFAAEVTRVAKEVGSDGRLGLQAAVPEAAGIWRDLTDNVNQLANNLTAQVRNIADITTSVANGDLSKKITVDAKGEVLELKNTVNTMVDQLNAFASEVTRVAREVGTEGKLGGQAQVPGALGTWRQLTDNVNQLAGNLTSQVRAISDVATAVTKGDFTRSIDVQAEGEVASLKDKLNQMIVNLKETTHKNTEQDWLKTNLAKFSGMMQGQKGLATVSGMIMSQLTPLVSAHHGAFFMMNSDRHALELISGYAYRERKGVPSRFALGEGLVGQCALEKKAILLTRVPADYVQISSGLGESSPLAIIVLPVLFEGEVKAVIELASFHPFSVIHQIFLDQLMESIGVVLNMITANTRTEDLLAQSQGLTQELLSRSQELTVQQDELKRSNVALEEKAGQLARASKYKSEFLANMSHELRTPLNSLLILARMLAENDEANLTPKQVEFARTIHSSGGDLLSLINEILDLSKVEAGKMELQPRVIDLSSIKEFVERSFRPVADQKGVSLSVHIAADVDRIRTDAQRVQQVLKNLLANAFKFTERGKVTLRMCRPEEGTRFGRESLQSDPVVAFVVEDTGIGIPADKQQIIFEAFQQADGTTNRRYGGTGLGLSISREISRLLGGEIHVTSNPGAGSTFTLYLPETYVDPEGHAAREAPPALDPVDESFVPSPALLAEIATSPIEDDRALLAAGDRVLLIVEDDLSFARIMVDMARQGGFKAVVATRGDSGLALARKLRPDAIALDIQLPVIDGWSVLDRLKRDPYTRHIPVHIISVVERTERAAAMGAFAFLEKPVTKEAIEAALAHIASRRPAEPLLEDTTSFLHRLRPDPPPSFRAKGATHAAAPERWRALSGKTALVIDDDIRNIYAMSSLLEHQGMRVRFAENGRNGITELAAHPEVDVVLMDVMMPEMDGYETMRAIRSEARYASLPIIAVTAKALKEDRAKCLFAGASDYLPKPIDSDGLFEMMTSWTRPR